MKNLNKANQTPLLLGAIAISPAVFVTSSLELAVIYGVIFLVALLIMKLISPQISKLVEPKYHFAVYAFIILVEITILEILLDAFLPLLIQNIGAYISLIAVQLLFIKTQDEEEQSSIKDTLILGLLFLAGLTLTGFLREALATLNIAYGNILPIAKGTILNHTSTYGLTIFQGVAGGFIMIGLLLGLASLFSQKEDVDHV